MWRSNARVRGGDWHGSCPLVESGRFVFLRLALAALHESDCDSIACLVLSEERDSSTHCNQWNSGLVASAVAADLKGNSCRAVCRRGEYDVDHANYQKEDDKQHRNYSISEGLSMHTSLIHGNTFFQFLAFPRQPRHLVDHNSDAFSDRVVSLPGGNLPS